MLWKQMKPRPNDLRHESRLCDRIKSFCDIKDFFTAIMTQDRYGGTQEPQIAIP